MFDGGFSRIKHQVVVRSALCLLETPLMIVKIQKIFSNYNRIIHLFHDV